MSKKIMITCIRPGMFRNGIQHPANAIYDEDRWSAAEIESFKADPAFSVVDVAENKVTEEVAFRLMTSHADELAALEARYDQSIDEAGKAIVAAEDRINELLDQLQNEKKRAETAEAEVARLTAVINTAAKGPDEDDKSGKQSKK